MHQIWKFTVPAIEDRITFLMPTGAHILSAQMQRQALCFWALVDPEVPPVARTFGIFGTGHSISDDVSLSHFIATVQMGSLVWHIFEVKS